MRRREKKNVYRSQENIRHDSWDIAGQERYGMTMTITQQIITVVVVVLGVFCLKDVPESTHYGLPEMIAILFIVVLHKWKKSTLLSIGGGTVFYMVLVQTIFG